MSTNISTEIINNEENININLDNEKEEEQCERCGEYHCEDDEEHEERVLWESNKDGKNICRKCVREEDEEEDGFSDCEDCGYTHHYEDKCPIGEQCEKYEKWREREEIHCKCGWTTGWAKKDGDGYEVEVGSADFVKKEFPDGNWYVQCNVCAEKEKKMEQINKNAEDPK